MNAKEKPVAMLLVAVDESTDRPEQTSHLATLAPNVYKLTLRPNVDKEGVEAEGMKFGGKEMESIVAHELGHFAAQILHDPSHDPLYNFLVGPLDGERKAWKIAKEIKPDLDEKFADWAISTYERRR